MIRAKDDPEQVGALKPARLHVARLYCILIEEFEFRHVGFIQSVLAQGG
ncbi:hypothetical protein SPX_27020 [Sporomusa paucivorans]|jgi:hypothetical protein